MCILLWRYVGRVISCWLSGLDIQSLHAFQLCQWRKEKLLQRYGLALQLAGSCTEVHTASLHTIA